MLIRSADACGADVGILFQAACQFPGKGLAFGFRGVVTQDKTGRTGKPGQAQPEHGACLQGQQGHEGQPAPAGGQHFHGLEDRQVQLDQQHQDDEHEKGRSRFQQGRDKGHVRYLHKGRMRGPAAGVARRPGLSGRLRPVRWSRSKHNTERVSRMSGTAERISGATEGPGKGRREGAGARPEKHRNEPGQGTACLGRTAGRACRPVSHFRAATRSARAMMVLA